jgi:hypothetical protein
MMCLHHKEAYDSIAKRLRSKAPSAASLSPGEFADRLGMGSDLLPTPYYHAASKVRERENI